MSTATCPRCRGDQWAEREPGQDCRPCDLCSGKGVLPISWLLGRNAPALDEAEWQAVLAEVVARGARQAA